MVKLPVLFFTLLSGLVFISCKQNIEVEIPKQKHESPRTTDVSVDILNDDSWQIARITFKRNDGIVISATKTRAELTESKNQLAVNVPNGQYSILMQYLKGDSEGTVVFESCEDSKSLMYDLPGNGKGLKLKLCSKADASQIRDVNVGVTVINIPTTGHDFKRHIAIIDVSSCVGFAGMMLGENEFSMLINNFEAKPSKEARCKIKGKITIPAGYILSSTVGTSNVKGVAQLRKDEISSFSSLLTLNGDSSGDVSSLKGSFDVQGTGSKAHFETPLANRSGENQTKCYDKERVVPFELESTLKITKAMGLTDSGSYVKVTQMPSFGFSYQKCR